MRCVFLCFRSITSVDVERFFLPIRSPKSQSFFGYGHNVPRWKISHLMSCNRTVMWTKNTVTLRLCTGYIWAKWISCLELYLYVLIFKELLVLSSLDKDYSTCNFFETCFQSIKLCNWSRFLQISFPKWYCQMIQIFSFICDILVGSLGS